MSTLKVNNIENLAGEPFEFSGDSGASAWANVAADGTIIASLNVASVNRTSTGKYTVTFSTPMPSANYSVQLTAGGNQRSDIAAYRNATANGFDVAVSDYNGPSADEPFSLAVFATNALPPKGGTGADAWVDVSTAGTPTSSFNATSSFVGQGTYQITFNTPMPTDSYAIATSSAAYSVLIQSKDKNGFQVLTLDAVNALQNYGVDCIIHATNATLPQTVTQEQIDAAINNPGASAWGDVEEDGTFNNGLNVASVVRASQGKYVVTFTTPLPNANYSAQVTVLSNVGRNGIVLSKSANSFEVNTRNSIGNLDDTAFSFSIFATNALPPKGGTGTDAWAIVDTRGLSTSPGTVYSVPGSFNIASVVKGNAIGEFVATFTIPMPTANYAVTGTCSVAGASVQTFLGNQTTTGFTLNTAYDAPAIPVNPNTFSFQVNATNATLPLTYTTEQIDAAINNPGASAWAKYDGINQTLLGGLNIQSITRTSQGEYDVLFATPMPDTNYSVTVGGNSNNISISNNSITANGFTIFSNNTANNSADYAFISFVVFATNALPPKGGTGADAWATNSGEGFNIASVTQSSGNGNNFGVVFTTPMPSDDYSVVATPITTSDGTCFIRDRTATGFTVVTRDYDGTSKALGWGAVVHATNATLPTTFTEAQIQSVIDAQPQGIAKAWVNFDGNSTPIVIRSSLNVSSITDDGTGQYTANFSTSMPDVNYAFAVSRNRNSNDAAITVIGKTSSSLSVRTVSETFQGLDVTECSIIIFSS